MIKVIDNYSYYIVCINTNINIKYINTKWIIL